MLSPNDTTRYQKNILLEQIGEKGQLRLKNAKVLVIGAGGLGTPVLQYLTAAGVGYIGIADNDTIDLSNLQRQVMYSTDEVGQSKTTIIKQKLEKLNPQVCIQTFDSFITQDNIEETFKSFDLIIDGSDNFTTRYLVNQYCVKLHKPLVYGSIYKFEGQLAVFNLSLENNIRSCNLLDVFPERPSLQDTPDCSTGGVIGALAGTIGSMMALEAIKIITQSGTPLYNKLLIFNALENTFTTLNILPSQNTKTSSLQTQKIEILATELQNISKIKSHIIDVRSKKEYAEKNLGFVNIPLEDLDAHFHILPKDKTIYLHCASGQRSLKAALLLNKKGYKAYSIFGGLSAIEKSRFTL